MRTILREIRKRPFTTCGTIGAVLFVFYVYPAPILWLRENVNEWYRHRQDQQRADELIAARILHNEGKLDAAADELNRMLTRWELRSDIHEELALVRSDQGRFEDALREIDIAIRCDPDYLRFYLSRVEIYFEMKEWLKVLEDCEAIVDRLLANEQREKPDVIASYRARQTHALALARLGYYDFAEEQIRELIRNTSNDRLNYSLLAEVFARQKDYKHALEYFNQAYQLREPDWTEHEDVASWSLAANELAELLATCPDASMRDGQRAKQIAEDILAKSDKFPVAKTTLAAAYAELGDFEKAVELQSQFMAQPLLNANSPHQQARLESYKRKQPFRLTRYEEP